MQSTVDGRNITLQIVDLSTGQGYECCITVLTLNGNGPPSCFRMAELEMDMTTTHQAEVTSTQKAGSY